MRHAPCAMGHAGSSSWIRPRHARDKCIVAIVELRYTSSIADQIRPRLSDIRTRLAHVFAPDRHGIMRSKGRRMQHPPHRRGGLPSPWICSPWPPRRHPKSAPLTSQWPPLNCPQTHCGAFRLLGIAAYAYGEFPRQRAVPHITSERDAACQSFTARAPSSPVLAQKSTVDPAPPPKSPSLPP
jgi:hypothetical protein